MRSASGASRRGGLTARTMVPSARVTGIVAAFSYRLPGKNIASPFLSERNHGDRAVGRIGEVLRRELLPLQRRLLMRGPGDLLHRRSEEHTSELQSRVDISYAVFCLKT